MNLIEKFRQGEILHVYEREMLEKDIESLQREVCRLRLRNHALESQVDKFRMYEKELLDRIEELGSRRAQDEDIYKLRHDLITKKMSHECDPLDVERTFRDERLLRAYIPAESRLIENCDMWSTGTDVWDDCWVTCTRDELWHCYRVSGKIVLDSVCSGRACPLVLNRTLQKSDLNLKQLDRPISDTEAEILSSLIRGYRNSGEDVLSLMLTAQPGECNVYVDLMRGHGLRSAKCSMCSRKKIRIGGLCKNFS
jgi:hypothetical protein